ncbi:hypothetical protein JTL98_34195, partial [Pseudomonas aeruginosa]|nr:hypothetical protein [Pseudomonas aeruginosa]
RLTLGLLSFQIRFLEDEKSGTPLQTHRFLPIFSIDPECRSALNHTADANLKKQRTAAIGAYLYFVAEKQIAAAQAIDSSLAHFQNREAHAR